MSLSDFVFRPFETMVRPLDIPCTPLPADGPFALVMHFSARSRHTAPARSMVVGAMTDL